MLTESEERNLLRMVSEIYHHLGLDGQRPVMFNNIREEATKDILKWKVKRGNNNHVSEKSS